MPKARFRSDALQDAFRNQQLDAASIRRIVPTGTVVPFEPVLTAPTTSPSGYNSPLTNDANRLRAFYIRQDDKFDMWFSLQCGSSFNGGVGAWSMSLPAGVTVGVTTGTTIWAGIGTWHAYDTSTAFMAQGMIWPDPPGNTTVRFLYPAAAPVGLIKVVGGADPWTWASGDLFGGHISLPIM